MPSLAARIGHAQYSEIAAAQRDDPVLRAVTFVAPTASGRYAELLLDPCRRRVEVRRGIDHMVDLHTDTDTTARTRTRLTSLGSARADMTRFITSVTLTPRTPGDDEALSLGREAKAVFLDVLETLGRSAGRVLME